MHTNQVVCKSHVSPMPFDFRLWTPSWCEWQVPRYHAIVCWWHGNKPMFCGKQIDGLARLSSFPHPIELLSGIQNCDTYSGAQNHMYIDREHCASRSRSRSVICSHFARIVIEICSNFAREMIASIFDREHLCEQPLNFKQFRRM